MAAGWFYTGGEHPYGYLGLGELFVFAFFGVVATVGSAYVQQEELAGLPFVASVPVGFLATALLVVNNLRDIPGDTLAGKRTLAVRLGDRRTRWLYFGLVAGSLRPRAVRRTAVRQARRAGCAGRGCRRSRPRPSGAGRRLGSGAGACAGSDWPGPAGVRRAVRSRALGFGLTRDPARIGRHSPGLEVVGGEPGSQDREDLGGRLEVSGVPAAG